MAEAAQKETKQRERPQPAVEVNLHPSESKGNTWHLDVPVGEQGVLPEELIDEAYWCHLANKIRPFDEVRAFSEDRGWYAKYLVLDVGTNWARVKLLEKHLLDGMTPETRRPAVGYQVIFKGNIRLWCIVRDADKKVIKDGMKSESEAYGALADFARQIKT